MKASEPKTKEEFGKYYDLRWRILRKPWNQPRGSEKDELEGQGIHVMVTQGSKVIGAGRGHLNTADEAQIRYMAVDDGFQGRGIGSMILKRLEEKLKQRGANHIVLNARESAVDFYKRHGYKAAGRAHTLFGSIPHLKMRKNLR